MTRNSPSIFWRIRSRNFGEVFGRDDSTHVTRREDFRAAVADHLAELLVAVQDGTLVVDQDPFERSGLEQVQAFVHLPRLVLFANGA